MTEVAPMPDQGPDQGLDPKPSQGRKLVLVDGSSYLYRAFHALPPLNNSKGEPTGAVLGVLNMLQKLLNDEQPALIAVVFDAPGKTFRDALFEQYKADRSPMPDDLRPQIQPLKEATEALGLPLLTVPGVEADDVIGTLAVHAAALGIDVLISTGDKDMAQLVNERITLVNTMTDTVLDRAGVKTKFDVFPEQIIDYLALVGDSSDNIPGVPKVGPKTAAKWLAEYSTLDGVIANAAAIGGKVGESLRASLESLALSRQLATIVCNVPLEYQPEQLLRREPDIARLRELYTRLELRSLLRALPGEGAAATSPTNAAPASAAAAPAIAMPAHHTEIVLTPEAFAVWLERLQTAPAFAFDFALSSPDYMRAEIVGVALAVEPDDAAYLPLQHNYPGVPTQLSREQVLQGLKPLLESATHVKVGHHLKLKMHVLAHVGIAAQSMRFDVMLESYVLNSTVIRHELEPIARHYLGIELMSYDAIAGKGAKQIEFSQVPIENAAHYVTQNTVVALQAHRALWPQIEAQPVLQTVYDTIEQPLLPVLQRMEAAGVLLDGAMLAKQSQEIARRLLEIEAEAHKAAGGPFNLDSPKQLQEILFGKLGLPSLRKTASGQPSTAEEVLEELALSYDLPRLIMDYRGVAKLKSTYTDKLPLQINRTTGRVHTSYHQAIAATGRLSSADPNLQNIPIRTAEGRRVRQAFIAAPGHCLVAADYSQIELRIMAHLSGDASLLAAFTEARDIHRATAAEVFGVPLDAVTADQRRSAKAINFGLIYGMSAFGLARQLGIEQRQAKKYIELYFQRYPGVRRYMDEMRQQAHALGYVETVFGRRLYLQEIKSRNAAMRQYAERSAINAPMQGTAADIIKRAMINIDQALAATPLPARLIMQVHDELVFEVHRDAVAALTDLLRIHMGRAAELRVPLEVDVGYGDNWDAAH